MVNLDTDGRFTGDSFASYDEAQAQFEELSRLVAGLPEPDRRTYYDQLCHSTLAFIQWRGEGLPFRKQLGDFLHVEVAEAGATVRWMSSSDS